MAQPAKTEIQHVLAYWIGEDGKIENIAIETYKGESITHIEPIEYHDLVILSYHIDEFFRSIKIHKNAVYIRKKKKAVTI